MEENTTYGTIVALCLELRFGKALTKSKDGAAQEWKENGG